MPNCCCCSMKFTGSTSCKACSGPCCSTCRNNGTYGKCCSCAGDGCARTGGGGGGGGGGGYASESSDDSWMYRKRDKRDGEAWPDSMDELEDAMHEQMTIILLQGEDFVTEVSSKIDEDSDFMAKVKELTIWNFSVSTLYRDDFAKILRGCPLLTHLKFGINNMGSDGFDDDVCDSLAGLSNLEEVEFSTVNIGNEGFDRLTTALAKLPKLKRVNFESIAADDSDWNLDDDEKSDLNGDGLAAGLKKFQNSNLKMLNLSFLSGENFNQTALNVIAELIKPPLAQLNLSVYIYDNEIESDETKLDLTSLSNAIASCASLVSVDISQLIFNSKQAEIIGASLANKPKLAIFKFGSYSNKADSVLPILKGLSNCKALKEVETGSFDADDVDDAKKEEFKNAVLAIKTDKLQSDSSWMKENLSREERKNLNDYYLTDSDDDSSY